MLGRDSTFCHLCHLYFTGNENFTAPPPDYYEEKEYWFPDIDVLQEMAEYAGDPDQMRIWLNQWREMSTSGRSNEEMQSWFDGIVKLYGPRIDGYESCIREFPSFISDPSSTPQYGVVSEGGLGNCSRLV